MGEVRLLTANLKTGPARFFTENGRQYAEAEAVIIVPGVLPGSKGPLYYPPAEVAKRPGAWNNVLVTAYHPFDPATGSPLSSKDRGVRERQGIGLLRNDRFQGGRRRVTIRFDLARTENYDKQLRPEARMVPRLRRGEPIELSTGLYTDDIPANNGKCPMTGRPYTHTAVNYRPDHLAGLPDQKGACSLNDGCGVLVNANGSTEQIDPTINPFVSRSQQRACYAKDDPDWDCHEWSDGVRKKDGVDLPERKTENEQVRDSDGRFAAGGASTKAAAASLRADTVSRDEHSFNKSEKAAKLSRRAMAGYGAAHAVKGGDTDHYAAAAKAHTEAAVAHQGQSTRVTGEGSKAHAAAAAAHRVAAEKHAAVRNTDSGDEFMTTNELNLLQRFMGWLTGNANPEGVNQYTHAAGRAAAASAKAFKSKSSTDHADAADAHDQAAEEAPTRSLKKMHEGKAHDHNMHGALAGKREGKGPFWGEGSKNSGNDPTGNASGQSRHIGTGQFLHTGGKIGGKQVHTAATRGKGDTDAVRQPPADDPDDDGDTGDPVRGQGDRGKGDTDHDAGSAVAAAEPTGNANPTGINQYTHTGAAELHDKAAEAHEYAAKVLGGSATKDANLATSRARTATDKTAGTDSEMGKKAQSVGFSAYQAGASKKSAEGARGPQAAQSAGKSWKEHHETAAKGHRELAESHRKSAGDVKNRAGSMPESVGNIIFDDPTYNEFDTDEQRQAYFGLLAAGKAGGDRAAGEEKSQAAMDKTKSANKGSRKSGHEAAAALHLAAAAHHDKAGDAGRAEMHRGMAAHHEAKAQSATRNEEVSTMSRQEKVALLTANCRCEETKANLKTVYNGLNDESLDVLVTNAKAEGSNADATAAGTDQVGGEEDDEDAHDMPGTGVRVHAAGKLAKNAEDEELREYGRRAMLRDKRALVGRLVVNVADPKRRESVANELMQKPIRELEQMAELIPAPTRTENRRRVRQDDPPALYLGAGGVVHSDADRTTDNAREDDDLLLDIPVLNMREISDSYNKKGSAVA